MRKSRIFIPIFVLLLCLLAGGMAWLHHGRDVLWRIVSTNCVPAAQAGKQGSCAEVALQRGVDAGDVVMKDRNGRLQYLLMPSRKVSGIEDPFLLRPDAPPYWADAWRARRWMDLTNAAPIPRDRVAIAVNSSWSRSQDQLHFHISCVRADIRSYLQSVEKNYGDKWANLEGGWQGHPYRIRRIVASDLDGQQLFLDIGREHADEMGRQALAAIGAHFSDGRDGFWLLTTHVDLLDWWRGGIEGDVQDHACAVLQDHAGEGLQPAGAQRPSA